MDIFNKKPKKRSKGKRVAKKNVKPLKSLKEEKEALEREKLELQKRRLEIQREKLEEAKYRPLPIYRQPKIRNPFSFGNPTRSLNEFKGFKKIETPEETFKRLEEEERKRYEEKKQREEIRKNLKLLNENLGNDKQKNNFDLPEAEEIKNINFLEVD